MDAHALRVLGYDELKAILADFAPGELSRRIVHALVPSSDPAKLRASLAQLAEARALTEADQPLPVRGLGDVAGKIAAAHRANRALEPAELLSVLGMLEALERLRDFFREHCEEAPRLAELAARIPDFGRERAAIDLVVEPPGVVKDRASPRLHDLRAARRDLEERLRALMAELAAGPKYRAHLMERTFSVRNGRYVLAVKLDRKGHVPGILHDKSASGGTAFVEPTEVVALSNSLSELEVDEGREIARILLEVSKPLYAEEAKIAYAQEVAAWLEFTAARAAMSTKFGLVAPRLSEAPMIRLRSGRHPLLVAQRARGELAHEVVPVSVTLGAEHRMLVVTGPNTGGKTVALKTIGLIQLMFQSGLDVPVAPGTELPCLGEILADIGDEQSLAQSLSTFSGHIRNIVRLLDRAGTSSLILLDELGAGTDPVEGAALGEALLERLLAREALTVVTTHLGSLKTFAFARAGVENACVAFDPETLEPSYELVVGQPGQSQALIIAERYGLDPAITAAARKLLSAEKGRADDLMRELMRSRVAAEEARRRSDDLVQQSEARLEDAATALGEARAERGRVEREAEDEIQGALDRLVGAVRPHLNALKNVPNALKNDVAALERLFAERSRVLPFAARRREFLKDLKKNDTVYVPRFGHVCRIEKMNRAEERLTVRCGALSMDIGFDDVSWVTPPDAPRG